MNVAAQVVVEGGGSVVSESWCVVRTDASFQALQTALDYACSAGADCSVLQPIGLCFLPNSIQAHASHVFNSFYQKKGRALGSCDFAGTATIAQGDLSMIPSPLPFTFLYIYCVAIGIGSGVDNNLVYKESGTFIMDEILVLL
ncbi:hypothetical protein TanjilG_14817 [Lupinus angustifolius]|uniref:X8 domain-containing protein n=1 Tax=Lupinus angustifolius TaxID=3871 RepID=A0A1J7GJD3_LUPAN|nr:hypothetical protein TanjilG_14817 [Lupinus angustifolius]